MALRQIYQFLMRRKAVRVALQAGVSAALFALLLHLAQQGDLAGSLRAIRGEALVVGFAVQGLAFALNSWRWQILLAHAGVGERFGRLLGLYHIGLFFSFFLPTGAGGDAVRMYDVARRQGRAAQVVLATLQERLLGLGASLSVGLAATMYYLPLLPPALRIWVIAAAIGGAAVVAALLYPQLVFALFRALQRRPGFRSFIRRLAASSLAQRVMATVAPIAALPPLPPRRFVLLLLLSHLSILMGIALYYILAQSLDVSLAYTAFCLAVPLTWIVRMAPISLGGLGVGEGAFVFMMSLFAVPADKALAIAIGFLGIQMCAALVGGAILALRAARSAWQRGAATPDAASAAVRASPGNDHSEALER